MHRRLSCALSFLLVGVSVAFGADVSPAVTDGATSRMVVTMGPPVAPYELLSDSPFGINLAFRGNTNQWEPRLRAMQIAGVKWGRQDFMWRRVEGTNGVFNWNQYDQLVETCQKFGVKVFGNLTANPPQYDLSKPETAQAYAAFAKAAAARYAGKVDHWQIWNEPNLNILKGDPEVYARLLTAAGKAIHEGNPKAKVLGLNMAFCDVIWAEEILKRVPNDCFDIICYHPYRNPNAPEDKFDWWVTDQYVKRFHPELTPDYPLAKASLLDQTDELIRVMKKHGPAKPIWITEMSFPSHIHPYGLPELRSADLMVRFHLLGLASQKIEKVFWWTLLDPGVQQFDMAEVVGLMRADMSYKYSFYAYGVMTRMLEGKKWSRNDSFGPDIYACTFTDEAKQEDTMVLWSTKPVGYVRINNTEKGLTFYDLYGTKRTVPYNKIRTADLPVPLGESPIYVVGPKGLKASVRPDPGW